MTAASSTPPAASVSPSADEPPAPGVPIRERGTSLHSSVQAESWTARGLTKVVHSVAVGVADLGGTVIVGEDLTARELTVRGTLESAGALSVEGELGVHGTVGAARGVRAGAVVATGSVRSDGPVVATSRLIARGTFSAPSASAPELRLSGVVRIPGEVRGGEAELELAATSSVGTVIARTVRAGGPEGGWLDRILGRARAARIGRIEAERVTLERVEVESVVASEVAIGRDCHVRTVEASRLTTHPSSRVGPESRSPPPPGLRR